MHGIPETIKLVSFAQKGLIFSAVYRLDSFPRITNMASNTSDEATVVLRFHIENNNIPCIEGSVKLDVVLECQRCLEGVRLHLRPNFKLAFVKNERQAETLDSSFETILNTDEAFSSIEFITDEILISLPMIPMHTHECQPYQQQQINIQKGNNPFAILKKLNQQQE